jgi:hypothetical protein
LQFAPVEPLVPRGNRRAAPAICRRIINWMAKKAFLACVAVVLLFLVAGLIVIYRDFWQFQTKVDEIIASLPEPERQLPPVVRHVFGCVEEDRIDRWVARNLLWEVKGPLGGLRWHFNFLMWEKLIGVRLSRRDRLSLFAHYLSFEKGQGLEAAAQYYFNLQPSQLEVEQVFGLLAVGRGPRMFSPFRNPERYRTEVERL